MDEGGVASASARPGAPSSHRQPRLDLSPAISRERTASRAFPACANPQPGTKSNPGICREERKILIFLSLLNECQALRGVEAVSATLSLEQDICLLQRQQHLHRAGGAALSVLLFHSGFNRPGHPHLLPDPPLPHHFPRPQEEDEEAENAEGSGGI
ncbi:unnamed protein product [Caretta caretta]